MTERHALVAVDIGGTFTDLAAILPDGSFYWKKIRTTPRNFAEAVEDALVDLASRVSPRDIAVLTHGTTAATNAVLEGRFGPAGFITTEGFRDVLSIGRMKRPNFYRLDWNKPAPLIPRRRILEVAERVDAAGVVERPLDPEAVRSAAEQLVAAGAETVAVGFLNSYANPAHELAAARVAAEVFGEDRVTASVAIGAELKEYERFCTAVVNAILLPIVRDYIGEIELWLTENGFSGDFFIMQCNGGVISADAGRSLPVHLLESGPAAGVLAAARLADLCGFEKAISLDVGGTTVKACLIEGGEAAESTEFDIGSSMTSASRLLQGSGYAVRVPCFEITEIGAGGGSIATVDDAGVLKVGPQSAGSEPGPACYGRGGIDATLTDACLLLGYIGGGSLAGGRLTLDRAKAEEAIARAVAEPLGLDPVEAAYGIFEVANSTMMRALRSISVERGRDPAEYTLVAFGGAGGVHAAALASELDVSRVAVPAASGIFSAFGMLVADVRRDRAQTLYEKLGAESWRRIESSGRQLAEQVRDDVVAAGGSPATVVLDYFLDVRYSGQSHELTVAYALESGESALTDAVDAFEVAFAREFGHTAARNTIELVTIRVRGSGERVQAPTSVHLSDSGAAPSVTRQAYFGREHGWLETLVLADRSQLADSAQTGPLVIEEPDATIVVPPGFTARLGDDHVVHLHLVERARERPRSDQLEVMRNRLEAVTDEMALTVLRTARSGTATELQDFSTAVCNARGEKVVQGLGVLIHLGSVTTAVEAVREAFSSELAPGDVFLLNDPYRGGTHLPDFILVRPVFVDECLIGYTVTVAHQCDIGSAVPGGNATSARELYEEGLIIPPLRVCRDDELMADVVRLVAGNVRVPDDVVGDLTAQIAACREGGERLRELCDSVGRDYVVRCMDDLIDYTERLTLASLAALPEGAYEAVDWLDDNGVDGEPVKLHVRLDLSSAGLTADFTGSSPQVASGLNCVPSTAMAALHFGLRCLMDADIPDNAGIERCIGLVAPAGSIVNPARPAPVAGRGLTAFRITDAVLKALSAAAPDRIGAAGDGGLAAVSIGGHREDGTYYLMVDTLGGAGGGRPNADGLQGVAPAIGNVRNNPIEVLERKFPVQIARYGFVPRSGAGQFRGGNALVREYVLRGDTGNAFCRSDRRRFRPWPLSGGREGDASSLTLTRGEVTAMLPTRVVVTLERGDRLEMVTASGAGWGPPLDRDPDRVREDLLDGLVTEQDAKAEYDVVLDEVPA